MCENADGMKVLIRNVRSFYGDHAFDVKPLTIVVGENSSGKSTLLGSISAMAGPRFPGTPGFNLAPFHFGGFESIATRLNGEPCKEIQIGFTGTTSAGAREISLSATYRNDAGLPTLRRLEVSSTYASITLEQLVTRRGTRGEYRARHKWRQSAEPREFKYRFKDYQPPSISNLGLQGIIGYVQSEVQRLNPLPAADEMAKMSSKQLEKSLSAFNASLQAFSLATDVADVLGTVRGLAPIRTKPHRTYDIAEDAFDPEGQHVPYRLRQEVVKGIKKLTDAVNEFGVSAGLFREVHIRALGQEASSPFQMVLDMGGEEVNLSDVGYGISQSLPVIVEAHLTEKPGMLLIQQPEVHLHPRAQAALGTFFCRLASAEPSRSYVLETHSDYIIGRIRQEVANGTIPADSVALLWVEKAGIHSTIHSIRIDSLGNVVDPPPGYRQFFLEEQRRLLERGSS